MTVLTLPKVFMATVRRYGIRSDVDILFFVPFVKKFRHQGKKGAVVFRAYRTIADI